MVMLTPKDIKKIMVGLGMTRPTELAYRCGVTDDAVRKWLTGQRVPRGTAIVLLHQLKKEAEQAAVAV